MRTFKKKNYKALKGRVKLQLQWIGLPSLQHQTPKQKNNLALSCLDITSLSNRTSVQYIIKGFLGAEIMWCSCLWFGRARESQPWLLFIKLLLCQKMSQFNVSSIAACDLFCDLLIITQKTKNEICKRDKGSWARLQRFKLEQSG